jgi:S1-C subfamily serine protease
MVATPDGYPIEDFFEIRPDELRVYNVNPYSPAYEAGIRTGDVILRIDGNKYENIFDVYAYLLNSELGQDIVIEYERDHSQMPPAVVTLAEKQTRFYGTTIEAYAYGPWSFDVTRYSSDLTY